MTAMNPPAHARATAAAAAVIGTQAMRRRLRVATAESCTGGMISAALTDAAGASAWFMGGVIAYNNDLKTNLVNVSQSLLAAHGAVSEETARAMCDGLFALGATAAASVTGIAGPGGGSEAKPVGYVCFAFRIGGGEAVSHAQQFAGERAAVRAAATSQALAMFADLLEGAPPSSGG